MKKLLSLLLAVILAAAVVLLPSAAESDKVAYISFNNGNDSNSGLTSSQAKRSLGSLDGRGAAGVISSGGTLVVSEKMYIGASSYSWYVGGPAVFTANYGGTDYRQYSGSTPTKGLLKMQSGAILSITSDVTMRDLILYQEGAQDTIIVSGGATLKIESTVTTYTTNTDVYMAIIVAKGSKVIVEGGTFDYIKGEGEIENNGATILRTASEVPDPEESTVSRSQRICYLNGTSGSNDKDGTSAGNAVKSLAAGLFVRMLVGGKAVVTGNTWIGTYSFPALPKPLTFTSVYGDADYRASASLVIDKSAAISISSDVRFDNIKLKVGSTQPTITVNPGAVFTITDSVDFTLNGSAKLKIVLSEGAYAHIPDSISDKLQITGAGEVISYVRGYDDIIEYVLGLEGLLPASTLTPGGKAVLNGTSAGQSAGEILALYTGVNAVMYRGETQLSGTDVIGTGCRIVVKDGSDVTIAEVYIVIGGDTSGDGIVNSDDLAELARHIAGVEQMNDELKGMAADIDGGGVADSDDLAALARYVAGVTPELG